MVTPAIQWGLNWFIWTYKRVLFRALSGRKIMGLSLQSPQWVLREPQKLWGVTVDRWKQSKNPCQKYGHPLHWDFMKKLLVLSWSIIFAIAPVLRLYIHVCVCIYMNTYIYFLASNTLNRVNTTNQPGCTVFFILYSRKLGDVDSRFCLTRQINVSKKTEALG